MQTFFVYSGQTPALYCELTDKTAPFDWSPAEIVPFCRSICRRLASGWRVQGHRDGSPAEPCTATMGRKCRNSSEQNRTLVAATAGQGEQRTRHLWAHVRWQSPQLVIHRLMDNVCQNCCETFIELYAQVLQSACSIFVSLADISKGMDIKYLVEIVILR